MKTTTISLLFTVFVIAAVTSCKKNSTPPPNNKSNTELLTQKAWKFETRGLDENNNGTIEESESDMLTCQLDDVFTFYTNSTGSYVTGSEQCAPDDLNTTFNWYFASNETELAIFAYPEKISKLDENTLEIYTDDQNSQGQPVKYITRFKH